jgi:hypothetical protein
LGYIPRGENKLISQFLNLGYTDLFEVKINRVSPEAHPEKQIGVQVKIREKKVEDWLSFVNNIKNASVTEHI